MRAADGTNLQTLQDYLGLHLLRDSAEPLNRQLYRHLRGAILDGLLARGSALPASRSLCEALSLGRNTVLHAYGQLEAEGYVASRAGAGTYVSEALPDPPPAGAANRQTASSSLPLSLRAQTLLHGIKQRGVAETPTFAPGMPDTSAFPWALWLRLQQRHQRDAPAAHLGYLSGGGHPALKAALAGYLRLSRGVNCDAEQILITGSMQQALHLVALATADAGDTVWMEEPGYPGARFAWQAAGLRIEAVATDEEGLCWHGKEPDPKLIYVTPSHQYPLGSVMSLARRHALLQQAAERGAWVVEDDYDSEFRHDGRPLAAMQGLDRQGRVIYLGTLSKVLFPALRMGYLVAPPDLIEPLRILQARLMREGSYIEQATLADFIEDGHFGAHLRRMRGIYAKRQSKLRDTLAAHLGDWLAEGDAPRPDQIALLGGAAGMHLTLRLPTGLDDQGLARQLGEMGLLAPALSSYCLSTPPFPGLVLGYGGADDATLMLAAVKLARFLAETLRRHNIKNE
ncbi:MAG: PLP-dependent aminotransferase family protein [Burkholderiales bacterium]|nr:PLP-dependent aminotransferase family protein [Burkholderiales bacterium]